ncbi:sensor domain-containing protein (plasmid) [Mycolicibacterium psychrotolerans]|uniref:sensor domain-containing protein n=1 Tax=Mycolicibacterium psychrotolerans TaxID=216929 RepID=UPI003D66F852
MHTTHPGSPAGAEDVTVPSPTVWRDRPWLGNSAHRPPMPPPHAPVAPYTHAPGGWQMPRTNIAAAPIPQAVPVGPWVPGHPAMPAPGPWAPPTRRRIDRRWLITGGVVVAVAAVVATVITVGVSDNSAPAPANPSTTPTATAAPAPTTSAPTPAPVPTAALTNLLLDPAAINSVMGAAGMDVRAPGTRDRLFTDTIDQPQCAGAWGPLLQTAYVGSGYLATQNQVLREPNNDQWLHTVFQGVVSFPTAEKAKAYADSEAQKWGRCTGVTLKEVNSDNHDAWTITSANTTGAVLTSTATLEGARGWGCQHALTVRNNVVIDVSACSINPGNEGETIAAKIADRIPAA